MRRLLLVIWITGTGMTAAAQLEPLSDQYLLNTLAINPAYAGSREALSITLFHRNQWTGFDGAPRTETLALHAPMRNDRVGLGLLAMSDRAGVASSNTFTGNFAFRIRVGEGIMSLGLGGGITTARNRWNTLVAVHTDDDLIPQSGESYLLPDFSIGIYYHTETLFLGFSLPMFLSHDFNPSSHRFDLVNNYSEYNYFLNGGYLFRLSTRWKVLPSAMIRFTPVSIPQADINTYVIYNDRVWAGVSYRSNRSLIGLLLYQVNKQLAVAYSYDMGMGNTGRYMGGSHEIMIRYDFRFTIEVVNPRYF